MITGELRNKVDSIWDTIWTGGISCAWENGYLSKYHAKKHVFFYEKCEIWYDRNEPMEKCSCGEPVRLLTGEEESYFWWRLSESGYEIVPYKERVKK